MTSNSSNSHSSTALAIDDLLAAERSAERAREAIGRSIYERRRELDLSGAQLARLARANASEVSKLERGQAPRGLNLARKLDETLSSLEAERVVECRLARVS